MIRAAILVTPFVMPALALAAQIQISTDDLSAWDEKKFAGQTSYQSVQLDQHPAIHARADHAASGLSKELEVDLNKTPWLHWRWKIAEPTKPPVKRDERTKSGDDYAARIYVIKKSGLFGLTSKAVNYVWSSNQPIEAHWPNAFTASAMMLAVQTGEKQAGQWLWQSRNVKQDFKLLFDQEVSQIHALALMTDTDNAGGVAEAWYADIHFSDSPDPESSD